MARRSTIPKKLITYFPGFGEVRILSRYSSVKTSVNIHSVLVKRALKEILREETLSNITTVTLRTIRERSTISKTLPAGVSVPNMMVCIFFLRLTPISKLNYLGNGRKLPGQVRRG